MQNLRLYFHIPFCRSRCGYCSFVSGCDLQKRGDYLAALCRALATAPVGERCIQSIYFGGGTPSLMEEGLLTVLEAAKARFAVAADAEITLEANPGTVTLPLLQKLRAGGFNRISFGLQDCDDDMLRLLGRRHTAAEGKAAVEMAKAAGFENISVDFMLATPHQTPEKARRLAEYGMSLGVQHISSYLLKIEEGTPFAAMGMAERCPDEDTAADCYLAFYEALACGGYEHYEISNAALPGYESRHNSAYWQLEDYLGIGVGASSLLGSRRFSFGADLDAFCTAEDIWSLTEEEGPGGTAEEAVMLALRLAAGLTPTLAARCGLDWGTLCRRAAPLKAHGLIRDDDTRITLTDEGFLLSNSIILTLLG